MTEGWDGKSVKEHIQDAENKAAAALEAVEALQGKVDDLEGQLCELEMRLDCVEAINV